VDIVDDDEALRDEFLQLRDERVDPLGGVDDRDHDREVVRQREDAGGVHVVRRAEPLDAAQHRRTGEAGSVSALDDLGGERRAAVVVAFADEDGETALRAFKLHGVNLPVG